MEDPGRLAAAVEARREALTLTKGELALKAGLSESTMRSIEAGRRTSLRASNRRSLAAALGWTSDSIDRILAGDDPVLAEPTPALRPIDDPVIAQQIADLQERLAAVEAELGIRRRRATDAEHAELEADAERRRAKRRATAPR